MHDPISAILATDRASSLATSALPNAPVLPVADARRRRVLRRLRLRAA
jgi:hypothetical protein